MGFPFILPWSDSDSTSTAKQAPSAPPRDPTGTNSTSQSRLGLSSISTAVLEAGSDDLAKALTAARWQAKAQSGDNADLAKSALPAVEATIPPSGDQSQKDMKDMEADNSLETLHTVFPALFTESMSDQDPLQTRHGTPNHRTRYNSVLPPTFTDFASRYPLITIASLVGTVVLLGTGALTARAFRSATRTRPPISLDVRLDDMERVIVTKIKQTQKKNAEGLNGALQRLAAGEMRVSPAASEPLEFGKGGSVQQLEEGSAAGVDESRLVQIVRETMKGVLAENEDLLQRAKGGGEDVGKRHQMGHVVDAIDRLEGLTLGILEEIKLLRASKAGSSTPSAPSQRDNGVLSMEELSGMVEQFQAQARAIQEEHPEAEVDVQSLWSPDVVDHATATGVSPLQGEASETACALHLHSLGGKAEAIEAVAMELGKANKMKKKRGKAVAVDEEEATSPSYTEDVVRGDGSVGCPAAPAGTIPQTPDLLSEPQSDTAEEQLLQPKQPAQPVQISPDPTNSNSHSSAGVDAQAMPPAEGGRKPTPLPQSTPRSSTTIANRIGIDDSGAWSCQVMPSKGDFFRLRKWCEMDVIVLRRTGTKEVTNTWNGRRFAFQSSETACEVVRTSVFRNPDVELVILDGAVWRCFSKGADGEYTIAERIGNA